MTGLDLFGSGYGQMTAFCELEILCCIKCKQFFDYLWKCLLLKEALVVVTCDWLVGCVIKMLVFDFFCLDRCD
jgi:hypothetical protein